MTKIPIECLRCGSCCKNLLRESEHGLHGLNLIPNERKLFPREIICPYMGVGIKKGLEPKYTIMYQLNVNLCPHLLQNNHCKIHKNRPWACQVFPIVSIEPPRITTECRFIKEITKGGMIEIIAPTEKRAMEHLSNYVTRKLKSIFPPPKTVLEYDLRNRKWIQIN